MQHILLTLRAIGLDEESSCLFAKDLNTWVQRSELMAFKGQDDKDCGFQKANGFWNNWPFHNLLHC